MSNITDDDASHLLSQLSDPEHWTDIQVDSFNYLVTRGLAVVFGDIRPIVYIDRRPANTGISLIVCFENPTIDPACLGNGAPMTRQYLYQHMLSYQGALRCNFVLKIQDNQHPEQVVMDAPRFLVGKFPVMVGSSVCSDPPATRQQCGYFIVNGQDKVIVVQERVTNNRVLLYSMPATGADGEQYICEVRSSTCNATRVPLILVMRLVMRHNQPQGIMLNIPFFRAEVPLMYVLSVLGCADTVTIMRLLSVHLADLDIEGVDAAHLLLPTMLRCPHIQDEQQLLTRLFHYMAPVGSAPPEAGQRHSLENLTGNILPHLGNTTTNGADKLCYLIHMLSLLLASASKVLTPCSRDSYVNKRLELPHTLLMQQLRSCLLRQRSILERNIAKGMSCVSQGLWKAVNAWSRGQGSEQQIHALVMGMLHPQNMTRGLSYAMLTGNWVTHASSNSFSSSHPRTGVVQLLQCYNQISRVSHLRRISTPQEKMGKLTKPRMVHLSSIGFVCPVETPEGPVCGLLTSFAIGARVSFDPSAQLLRTIRDTVQQKIAHLLGPAGVLVFFGGSVVGQTRRPGDCVELLRESTGLYAEEQNVHVSVSVGFDRCVYIEVDGGRLLRLLLRVETGRLCVTAANCRMPLEQLVRDGHILVVDPSMTQNMRIASHWASALGRVAACEIHMQSMLGLAATLIPRIECNQSPRNAYQSAMTKQSVGVWQPTSHSLDANVQFLVHTERPMLESNLNAGVVSMIGQNVIIAVSSYSGCNQNDAIVMSQGAVDQGLFNSHHVTIVKVELRNSEALVGIGAEDESRFCTLHPITGVVNCGETVHHGDRLLLFHKEQAGTTPPLQQLRLLKPEESPGVVEQVDILLDGCALRQCSRNGQPHEYYTNGRPIPAAMLRSLLVHLVTHRASASSAVTIRIRIGGLRVPQIGDKFASRHGQKGTIGAILPVEDMPFLGSGTVPDLLFNSHGIPSRMTIGQLWEVVLSKYNLCGKQKFHGRCFDRSHTRALYKAFKLSDAEPLYSGLTGELLGQCSTGMAFYQRLKHMTRDKIHARALGPVTQMVRQPTDGRARAGGLRIGEMERDALIANGCISFLTERLLWKSDAYRIVVCSCCGSYPATQTMWLPANGDSAHTTVPSCTGCKGQGTYSSVVVPYSFKLLLQEAASTGIRINLETQP